MINLSAVYSNPLIAMVRNLNAAYVFKYVLSMNLGILNHDVRTSAIHHDRPAITIVDLAIIQDDMIRGFHVDMR